MKKHKSRCSSTDPYLQWKIIRCYLWWTIYWICKYNISTHHWSFSLLVHDIKIEHQTFLIRNKFKQLPFRNNNNNNIHFIKTTFTRCHSKVLHSDISNNVYVKDQYVIWTMKSNLWKATFNIWVFRLKGFIGLLSSDIYRHPLYKVGYCNKKSTIAIWLEPRHGYL